MQRRLEQAEQGPANGPETPECKAEAAYREQVRAAVLKTMDAQKLDAFVYPTWSNPPRLIGDLNTPGGDNSQFFSPTTGLPGGAGADGLHARRAAAGRASRSSAGRGARRRCSAPPTPTSRRRGIGGRRRPPRRLPGNCQRLVVATFSSASFASMSSADVAGFTIFSM